MRTRLIIVPKPRIFEVAAKTAQDRLQCYPDSHVQIIKSTEAYNIVAQGAGCMVLDYFLSTPEMRT
ncbi:hypothetical protein EJ573_19990 [Paenibacillus polymyxa]|nr:hypothetical protein FGY93_04895 [Paenibacillus polymyxa]RTZ31757.1 hypothetical protein EJ573_19990 [Paenibacillus polymyxa]